MTPAPALKRDRIVSRRVADVIAFGVAMAVLVAGLLLVIGKGPSFDPPTKTTTAVEIGKGSGIGKRTETTEIDKTAEPSKGGEKSTKAVEVPTGLPSTKETTTVEEGSRSFAERVLGESGLILLQLGVILLAAFLAGAFTQRVLMGDFALKLGGLLELGAVQQTAEKSLVDLTAKVAKVTEAQAKQQGDLEKMADNVRQISSTSVNVGLAIAQLRDQLEKLESETGETS